MQHGCVSLVRFVLVDMFVDSGYCKCGRHGASAPALTREQLLWKTCSYMRTAVNMAAMSGGLKMVVLSEWAIKTCRCLSGQLTKETRLLDPDYHGYTMSTRVQQQFVLAMCKENEVKRKHAESTCDRDNYLQVPNVKDDDLSILYSSNNEVESKVIFVIEEVLGDPSDEHRKLIDMVKKWVAKDVDFKFVPLARVFLHFFCSVHDDDFSKFNHFRKDVTDRIFDVCNADGEDGDNRAMLTMLFNILDPQGRPLLHAAFESYWWGLSILDWLGNISPSIKAKLWNARDGAGRSIFHLMSMYNWFHPWLLDFKV